MRLKVVTLPYVDSLGGFPQQAVDQACSSGGLFEVRDHFFIHRGVPHLALVMLLDDAGTGPVRAGKALDDDPGRELPESLQSLYRALRHWRNERAKADGVPAYVVLRNAQLAEICRKLPRSLAALRQIEGFGEGTCEKYGKEILAMIPPDMKPEASGAAPGAPEQREEKQ
jgi:superfamily II DNA helicase RecQ